MNQSNLAERVQAAAARVSEVLGRHFEVGIVLGSGLGSLVDRFSPSADLPYASIPEFPVAGVAGHAGRLVRGSVNGRGVLIMQGRAHYYEGHDLASVTLPIRVLSALGVETLILTAAAGGIAPDLPVGQIVCLSDHINMMGANPLRGLSDPRLGERFPDMTRVYDPALRALASQCAAELGLTLRAGVYAAMSGPSYETPAEIRVLRVLGADVVGMSVVPESIVARQCGLRVLAFALVTNQAAGLSDTPIAHEEVLAVGRGRAAERLGELISAVLADPGFQTRS